MVVLEVQFAMVVREVQFGEAVQEAEVQLKGGVQEVGAQFVVVVLEIQFVVVVLEVGVPSEGVLEVQKDGDIQEARYEVLDEDVLEVRAQLKGGVPEAGVLSNEGVLEVQKTPAQRKDNDQRLEVSVHHREPSRMFRCRNLLFRRTC